MVKSKLDKDIEKIILSRMKQKFIHNTFSNITKKVDLNRDKIYFYYKNIIIAYIETDKNIFYYDFINIYNILNKKFNLNHDQINLIILKNIKKYLNITNVKCCEIYLHKNIIIFKI